MTVQSLTRIVLGWGLATMVCQIVGLDNVGGLMALIHLGGLIGAPLAMTLNRHLRSPSVMVALSIALSIALSALAVQSLIWFAVANRLLLIAVGTAYGVGLAALLSGPEPAPSVQP
jgi:CBS-domain-containing membrane protein